MSDNGASSMPEEQGVKLLAVTQADRDLAIFLGHYPGSLEIEARAGEYDDSDIIQSIARHRIAAQSADDTLIAELVGALEGLLSLVNRNDVASWLACEHPAEFCNAEDAVSDAQQVLQSAKNRRQS